MRKKGQALVEFIIILPVFLMLVLGVVDIGKILYEKIKLESQMTDVISLYDKGISLEEIKDKLDLTSSNVDLEIKNEKNFILKKKIDIITPGLNLIFSNPYDLTVSRSAS